MGQTLQLNHPSIGLKSADWVSQNRNTYGDPRNKVNPTFRQTAHISMCPQSLKSGYETNYTTGDRQGWVPHRILNGDRTASEYRRHFNKNKRFHRKTRLFKLRKLN